MKEMLHVHAPPKHMPCSTAPSMHQCSHNAASDDQLRTEERCIIKTAEEAEELRVARVPAPGALYRPLTAWAAYVHSA